MRADVMLFGDKLPVMIPIFIGVSVNAALRGSVDASAPKAH